MTFIFILFSLAIAAHDTTNPPAHKASFWNRVGEDTDNERWTPEEWGRLYQIDQDNEVIYEKANLDLVHGLIANGRVNDTDSHGWTALIWAASLCDPVATEALIDAHVNVNQVDDAGYPPITWAAWYGCRNTLTLLLDAGADLNAQDAGGATALYWALHQQQFHVADVLIYAGAHVHTGARSGKDPRDLVVIGETPQNIVDAFLAAGDVWGDGDYSYKHKEYTVISE